MEADQPEDPQEPKPKRVYSTSSEPGPPLSYFEAKEVGHYGDFPVYELNYIYPDMELKINVFWSDIHKTVLEMNSRLDLVDYLLDVHFSTAGGAVDHLSQQIVYGQLACISMCLCQIKVSDGDSPAYKMRQWGRSLSAILVHGGHFKNEEKHWDLPLVQDHPVIKPGNLIEGAKSLLVTEAGGNLDWNKEVSTISEVKHGLWSVTMPWVRLFVKLKHPANVKNDLKEFGDSTFLPALEMDLEHLQNFLVDDETHLVLWAKKVRCDTEKASSPTGFQTLDKTQKKQIERLKLVAEHFKSIGVIGEDEYEEWNSLLAVSKLYLDTMKGRLFRGSSHLLPPIDKLWYEEQKLSLVEGTKIRVCPDEIESLQYDKLPIYFMPEPLDPLTKQPSSGSLLAWKVYMYYKELMKDSDNDLILEPFESMNIPLGIYLRGPVSPYAKLQNALKDYDKYAFYFEDDKLEIIPYMVSRMMILEDIFDRDIKSIDKEVFMGAMQKAESTQRKYAREHDFSKTKASYNAKLQLAMKRIDLAIYEEEKKKKPSPKEFVEVFVAAVREKRRKAQANEFRPPDGVMEEQKFVPKETSKKKGSKKKGEEAIEDNPQMQALNAKLQLEREERERVRREAQQKRKMELQAFRNAAVEKEGEMKRKKEELKRGNSKATGVRREESLATEKREKERRDQEKRDEEKRQREREEQDRRDQKVAKSQGAENVSVKEEGSGASDMDHTELDGPVQEGPGVSETGSHQRVVSANPEERMSEKDLEELSTRLGKGPTFLKDLSSLHRLMPLKQTLKGVKEALKIVKEKESHDVDDRKWGEFSRIVALAIDCVVSALALRLSLKEPNLLEAGFEPENDNRFEKLYAGKETVIVNSGNQIVYADEAYRRTKIDALESLQNLNIKNRKAQVQGLISTATRTFPSEIEWDPLSLWLSQKVENIAECPDDINIYTSSDTTWLEDLFREPPPDNCDTPSFYEVNNAVAGLKQNSAGAAQTVWSKMLEEVKKKDADVEAITEFFPEFRPALYYVLPLCLSKTIEKISELSRLISVFLRTNSDVNSLERFSTKQLDVLQDLVNLVIVTEHPEDDTEAAIQFLEDYLMSKGKPLT